MAVYTVSIRQSGAGSISLGDGTLLANLSVSAGRGPKGDGWTGVSYDGGTGTFVFTSNDGLSYTSENITSGLDAAVAAAAADRAAVAADLLLTDADTVATAADRAAVAADLLLTDADTIATAADRVQTGLDAAATAADVVSTNADVVTTSASAAAVAVSVSEAEAAVAMVNGVVTPLNSEILWPVSLTALPSGWYDTTLRLLSGTAARAILSNNPLFHYVESGLLPDLVLDFVNRYYRTGGTATTFDDALTYTGASNGTMTDSDGLLKWKPHNLQPYSEDLDNSIGWTFSNSVADDFQTVREDSATGLHYYRENTGRSYVLGDTYTVEFKVKRGVGSRNARFSQGNSNVLSFNTKIDLGTGAFLSGNLAGDTISAADAEGFFAVKLTRTVGLTQGTQLYIYMLDGTDMSYAGDNTSTLNVKEYTIYRSDLGGMVNNPDTGNSYVPTTSAAKYLPRVGNHVYNGTSWVNEGLLLESEARTNLLLNSATLATQDVTVTAVPHTVHFTGTGENNRVSLTFTPTAGTLTLTVSGTVTNAQLE